MNLIYQQDFIFDILHVQGVNLIESATHWMTQYIHTLQGEGNHLHVKAQEKRSFRLCYRFPTVNLTIVPSIHHPYYVHQNMHTNTTE